MLRSPVRSYDTLNGLRGLAALIVVIHHVYSFTPAREPFPSGYFTLHLFFALSGFVLTALYGPRLSAGMTVRQFMGRRIKRLYPTFLLGAVLGLYSLKRHPMIDIVTAPLSFLMLPNPFTKELFPSNPPMWTLAHEMTINVVMVLVWRFLSNRVLWGVIVLAAATNFYFLWNDRVFDGGYSWETIGKGMSMGVMSFFLGVAVQRTSWRPKILPPWVAVGLVVAVSALSWRSSWLPIVDLALTALVLPFILLCAASWEPDRVSRVVFRFFGNASYPLYVIHLPVMVMYGTVLVHVGLPTNNLAILLAGVAPMVIAAWAIDRYYEPWARRWIDLLPGPTRSKAAAATAKGADAVVSPT